MSRMRTRTVAVLVTAALAAAALLSGLDRTAIATALPAADELGPTDAVALRGKDGEIRVRNEGGRPAWGTEPTARAWSMAAVNSDRIMKLLLRSERFDEERKQLEESGREKDAEFRRRFQDLESKYKDLTPDSPGFADGRAEVEAFFREVEQFRKETGDRLGKLQAEQIERAYREMAAAIDVVAERQKIDVVFRFVPTSQAFESGTAADAMLQVQVRTFLRYPEEIDVTAEVMKEMSLKDE